MGRDWKGAFVTRSLQQGGRTAGRRRGVTLVEMLVTLAVLLLMMTVIVQIFQAATGALNAAQVYQVLDNQLRLLDSTIRSDLGGVTCRLTPPNDPRNNPGYFEYGENEFADVQGEDSDDYIRFTSKAPAGRPFTGRMWVPPVGAATLTTANATALFLAGSQPISITSEYAEIIYFLRNGNLYRRVLLVAPQRQGTLVPTISNTLVSNMATIASSTGNFTHTFNPATLGAQTVSWQGVNDLSAHPAPRGAPPLSNPNSVILNTLGDLTNRENRSFLPRFGDDFWNLGTGAAGQDGLSDDLNGDNVPDYYPTFYPTVQAPTNSPGLIYEPAPYVRPALPMQAMAFPYVFPGAYSTPQVLSAGTAPYGWIHSPNPQVYDPVAGANAPFDTKPLRYLQLLNHNPLDTGDNLQLPQSGQPDNLQTWWGFPTWRETLSPNWTDPTWQVNTNVSQPFGLAYQAANPSTPPIANTLQLLPDMTSTYRNNPQLYNDGLPANANPNPVPNGFFPTSSTQYTQLWNLNSWEDDLIMTGVRSFDVKAYDNAYAGYVDLGWGDDARVTGVVPAPYLTGTVYPTVWNGGSFDTLNQTFAHEGRMPPLVADLRFDAQYGQVPTSTYAAPNHTYTGNVGDDNPAVARLRRVWDSWSTEYTQAPGTGVCPAASTAPFSPFFPAGPPSTPPIYPSYPPPYPAPLRGIQIQIRVADPTSQRIKTLTIRQDFTDKL